jgi:Protein of unknown function (DUF3631)
LRQLGAAVTKQERKHLKRIGDLFRKMVDGASTAPEREQTREKLAALLKKLGKTWSDLSTLLAQEKQTEEEEKAERAAAQGATYNPTTGEAVKPQGIPCIDLVYDMLTRYLDLKDYEFVAVTLWVLHTWVYDRYRRTPRLAVMSPIPDCGKTALMELLEQLTFRGEKIDDASAASICRLLDKKTRTLLLDEMDNVDWKNAYALRKVINSGYQRGGKISRVIDRDAKVFPTFAPMALAAIGRPLPGAVLSRSICINMQRSREEFKDFDFDNLNIVRGQIWLWARPDLTLDPDPAMPRGLRAGRPRDKWRPLFAIADSFGIALHTRDSGNPKTWGQLAREAALAFARNRHKEEISVELLEDIRGLFTSLNVDRFLSKVLVKQLRELADSQWADVALTEGKLAQMLEPFGVGPGRIWSAEKRTPQSKQGRGYLRVWFEEAWRRYLDDKEQEHEPSKSAKILHLRGD